MLYGIDTSNWQGHVDWHAVRSAGYDFGAVKASQGTRFPDDWFGDSWEQLGRDGMHRIAYHFFEDMAGGVAQCDYMHQWVHDHGHFVWGDMGALDVEEAGITRGAEAFPDIVAFIRRFWASVAKPLVIYTNVDTWVNLLGNPTSKEVEQCPLWLADLGTWGQLPRPWSGGPAFEQWSWHGTVPGVAGQVDLDRFRGTRQQLDKIRYTVPHV